MSSASGGPSTLAGLPEPRPDWTWAELRQTAQALTDHDASPPRYGFGFEPAYWWLVWLWQNGCPVLDHPLQPTTVRLDAPACAEALTFLQDLIQVDRVTPPLAELTTGAMNRLFREGRLAMMFGNHGQVPSLSNTAGLSWQVAPLPRAAQRANVAGGAGFVLSRRSAHKAAAWQLIQFLTGPKAQALLAESGVITPARRSVREESIFLRQQAYRAEVFVAESEVGRTLPNFPGVTQFTALLDEGLQPLWRGEQSAAEVLAQLIPRLQQIVAAVRTAGP